MHLIVRNLDVKIYVYENFKNFKNIELKFTLTCFGSYVIHHQGEESCFFFIRHLTSIVKSFGLLNDIFPFCSILDANCPIFYIQLMDILYYTIFPSFFGPSLGSCSLRCPVKYFLKSSRIWHPLYMAEPAEY